LEGDIIDKGWRVRDWRAKQGSVFNFMLLCLLSRVVRRREEEIMLYFGCYPQTWKVEQEPYIDNSAMFGLL